MLIRHFWNRMVFDAEGGAGAGAAASGAASGAAGSAAGAAGAGASAAAAPVAFADTLPADIREEAAFRDIKDLDSLAKSFLHAQKVLGADPSLVVRVPAADDQAAWDAVYAKLGRPEKVDGYALSKSALPEGLSEDEGLRTGYLDAAHKAGLSTKQADQLYQWWNSQQAERFTAAGQQTAQAAQAAEQALRGEWGQAFDQNLQMARDAINHYGGDKLKAELEAKGLANSGELAKVFAKLGKDLQEDGLIGRGGGSSGDISSPTEARQQINALRQDPAFVKAYTDKSSAGHKDAVAKMTALYSQAYPPEAA